jgi:hypothetical protein
MRRGNAKRALGFTRRSMTHLPTPTASYQIKVTEKKSSDNDCFQNLRQSHAVTDWARDNHQVHMWIWCSIVNCCYGNHVLLEAQRLRKTGITDSAVVTFTKIWNNRHAIITYFLFSWLVYSKDLVLLHNCSFWLVENCISCRNKENNSIIVNLWLKSLFQICIKYLTFTLYIFKCDLQVHLM